MDPTLLVLRWAHVLAAIVAMGGLVFARFALLPALSELDSATRDRVHDRIRRSWLPWVIGAITVLLATGLVNFLLFNARVKGEGWASGEWMRQTSYHALFGAKFLLALVVFYFASALVGRGAGTAWVRNDRAKWLSVTIGLMLAVVLLSGWMRQLHTGPNVMPLGDGGVMIERRNDQDNRREGGEDLDGQKSEEADRGAAAEDREAPAAGGGSEEAAR
ncbi:MAG: sulfite exporter TauE/SafE family protein [Planctomycetia bacterium]|nr:sulfite exporter TauE/SafE family protein [Planctomycetia bacterium]